VRLKSENHLEDKKRRGTWLEIGKTEIREVRIEGIVQTDVHFGSEPF